MLSTKGHRGGAVTAPHRLAAEAGLAVLKEGGSAIEAAVAMAAALAVVYPHMTGIGGDAFWLLAAPGQPPLAVQGAGPAGAKVNAALYAGQSAIPTRGPLAANTVAGAVDTWREALRYGVLWGGKLPLARLLEPAIHLAEQGFPVSRSQAAMTAEFAAELASQPGFAAAFLRDGAAPAAGDDFRQPALAASLRALARDGLEAFYRGKLGAAIAAELENVGSPLTKGDIGMFRAAFVSPLVLPAKTALLYNLPPPTQGLASLMILGLFERLGVVRADGFSHVHGLVEATRAAFEVRDRLLGDPDFVMEDPREYLTAERLDDLAATIDRQRAGIAKLAGNPGGTTWFGAIDGAGRTASVIQSLYFEFGSGVVLPETGILWQNRGSSFRLGGQGPRVLEPGRLPFHTLNPAVARFQDGRVMAYGSMGGDGQPQFQAEIFTRYAWFGAELADAIAAPRWLLGKTWGRESPTLKLEAALAGALATPLAAAGHEVEVLPDGSASFGHAGAVVRHGDGTIEAATDPRSDGAALGF